MCIRDWASAAWAVTCAKACWCDIPNGLGGEKKPGELSNPEGLNPGGTVNNGDRATIKFIGLLCLNPDLFSPPFSEPPSNWAEPSTGFSLNWIGLVDPIGEPMAPARS